MAVKPAPVFCQRCGKPRKEIDYYKTASKMYPSGRLTICKSCILEMVDPNDMSTVYSTLRQIDKPFLSHVWKTCVENGGNIMGNFLRNINSLPQYKGLTWEQSLFDTSVGQYGSNQPKVEPRFDSGKIDGVEAVDLSVNNEYIDPTVISNRDKIVAPQVTEELYRKWSRKFSPSEILDFEDAYKNLESSFEIENTNQEAYLKMACINQVKAMYAMANNNAKEAKDYMDMFHKTTQAGNLQPAQNKKDLTQGINSFSEMVKNVEQAVDVIGILPKFRERPQDKVDIVIWAFVNYIRNLKGSPDATYEEIWRWYDTRKKAYEDMASRIADLDKGDGDDEIIGDVTVDNGVAGDSA